LNPLPRKRRLNVAPLDQAPLHEDVAQPSQRRVILLGGHGALDLVVRHQGFIDQYVPQLNRLRRLRLGGQRSVERFASHLTRGNKNIAQLLVLLGRKQSANAKPLGFAAAEAVQERDIIGKLLFAAQPAVAFESLVDVTEVTPQHIDAIEGHVKTQSFKTVAALGSRTHISQEGARKATKVGQPQITRKTGHRTYRAAHRVQRHGVFRSRFQGEKIAFGNGKKLARFLAKPRQIRPLLGGKAVALLWMAGFRRARRKPRG